MDMVYGLYDEVLRTSRYAELAANNLINIDTAEIDDADLPHIIGSYIGREYTRAFASMRKDEIIAVANRALAHLGDEGRGALERKLLTEIRPTHRTQLKRPTTPLSEAALLTNSVGDPQLSSELAKEISSADRIDLICSFIKHSGMRLLDDALAGAAHRGVPIRVLTTTYMGATEEKALENLVERFGAEVKINYDAAATSLHAKAWLFYRNTGFDTGYIGSSNMSRRALTDGLEWNVRISATATPTLLDKFTATFESYWGSSHFDPYHPEADRAKLRALLAANRGGSSGYVPTLLQVRPYPHQEQMLAELDAERRAGRHRNLLVAATGTGKTVVAALDYRRLAGDRRPSLLFVAHRREILDQARRTYRDVLGDGSFGELLIGSERPVEGRHVFASVQSLSRDSELEVWDPDAFDIVVIDEFHHASALTYRRVIDHLRPRQLLGLTATPERADGIDVAREFFDGRIASELRLWDALENDLLVPFHYFGIADGTDLSKVRFTRGTYDLDDLSTLYTSDHARVRKILASLNKIVADPTAMRALGFCVSVDHARFMAEQFTRAGLPARALSGLSTPRERAEALDGLRDGKLTCLFAVDLFNEGLDIPDIDTILMLRPTQSATVFLQQLGRGLRRAPGKAVLTVLDYVGIQHDKFRFDLKLTAMTGLGRGKLAAAVTEGFSFLPAGTQIRLDRQTQREVLSRLQTSLPSTASALVSLTERYLESGRDSLGGFLDETGLELTDIYRSGTYSYRGDRRARSWTSLRAWARGEELSATEKELAGRIWKITCANDRDRIEGYRELIEGRAGLESPYAPMLYYTLWPTEPWSKAGERLARLRASKNLCEEITGVLDILEGTTRVPAEPMTGPLADVPLRTHASYTREEILAAFRLGVDGGQAPGHVREGTKWIPQANTEVLLVTLAKSEKDFSPSTMYRDYAISPTVFHWESQSGTTPASEAGRRYQDTSSGAPSIVLAVRERKMGESGTSPYVFLGSVTYLKHRGSRPMAIEWELARPLPPDLYLHARVAG